MYGAGVRVRPRLLRLFNIKKAASSDALDTVASTSNGNQSVDCVEAVPVFESNRDDQVHSPSL